MSKQVEPRTVDLIDGVIRGGQVQYTGGRRQRNVRLAVAVDAMVENLAKESGVPFGLMHNLVVEAGLEALRERIGEERFSRYERMTREQMAQAEGGEAA